MPRWKLDRSYLRDGEFYPESDVICEKCKKHWRYFAVDLDQGFFDDDNRVAHHIVFGKEHCMVSDTLAPAHFNRIWFCSCKSPLISEVVNENIGFGLLEFYRVICDDKCDPWKHKKRS